MLALLMSLASFLVLATSTSLLPQKNASHESVVSFANTTYVEWTANDTVITFTINSSIDKGWFLLGWMKSGNARSTPKKLIQTRADVLVFLQKKVLDCNTLRKKGGLQKDKDKNDLITKVNLSKQADGKSVTVWKVTRRLDTENIYEDVAIKPGPMLLFGAQGKNITHHLKDIPLKDIDSSIEFVTVHFVVEHPPDITPATNGDNTTGFVEFVGRIIREHWIAVVVGIASVATVFITLLVYCCFRKKKNSRNKKVKVSFFKEEEDFDQEARVALISATT